MKDVKAYYWVLTDVENGETLIKSSDPRDIAEYMRQMDTDELYEDEAVLELTVEDAD